MGMTNVDVRATGAFSKFVGGPVRIGLEDGECENAYPSLPFDRDIIGGCGMMCSVLTLTVGSSQGVGGVEFGKISDVSACRGSRASSLARPASSWA